MSRTYKIQTNRVMRRAFCTKQFFLPACSLLLSLLFVCPVFSQTITITAPVSSATYCAGASLNVSYTISPSTFTAGNVFTAQLSDAAGSFGAPVSIGTRTATSAGTNSCTIPFTTSSGTGYRIRMVSSNPTYTSQSNGVNLSINGLTLNTPTVTGNTFCTGELMSVNFSQTTSCPLASGNIYSVQLSDASGSFTAPLTIGTRTSTSAAAITCTVPVVTSGTGYRVRIVSSNPALTSADNGTNITINASSGSPSVAGNGAWNAYCFNAADNYSTNYQGFYTENNLSFNTATRWANTSCPATANNASGNAYAGCTFTSTNNYSVGYKRTNIPCGYYDFSVVGHDDILRVLVDGVQVYSSNYVGGIALPSVYRAFISPTNTVDVRISNTGAGPGYLSISVATVNILSMSPPITICAGTSGTIAANNTTTVALSTFSWFPMSAITGAATGTIVEASPSTTTIYTVTTNEPLSGCSVSNTLQVTINPLATTTVVSSATTQICSGITTAILTAGGAASYTWSPSAGLSAVNGYSVIASPTITTTYTVSGSNNCNTLDALATVTVQTIPSAPTPTTFGNGTWHVYSYNGRAFTTYYGYYTENNLSFNTTNRWASGSTPSAANASSGLAYQGCNIPVDYHSTIHKRTNFTCGYYQIDIPSHDDDVTLLIDGVQVFQHIGCCDAHTNVWTGYLGPSTTVEIRHQEGVGGSNVAASFSIIANPVVGPPITICAGGPATITATPYASGATYSWTPNISLSSTTGTAVVISPTTDVSYTCTVIDPVTSCTASAVKSVSVNPLPTTTISATTSTIACSIQSVTLSASGAYTYSWSPSSGLTATTEYSVIATPSVTTVYTVTGSNICADIAITTTVNVVPLVTPTVFPTNTWNVYCHNNTTLNNYYGYYTENGSGTSGYDFNTATRWASGAAPSTASATNGQAYQGCTTSSTNISLSFKRTGFTCNTYTVYVLLNDDNCTLLINGVQVATRAFSSSSVAYWSGPLTTNSTVEFQLTQGGGGSGLNVRFTPATATASLSTWVGGTSSDWFTASNWCGSGVPNSSTDAVIPSSTCLFQPTINASGAACRSFTISGAIAASAPALALTAASLTISGFNGLEVHGNWVNNGVFNAGSSTVNIMGSTSTSITGSSTESFYNLTINKTGTVSVTVPSGVHQITNNMNFVNGVVNQNGTLRFLNGSTASGANNNSYVNGQVIKVGTQGFTFPVGANSFYRPITISAPSVATDHFTAQYFDTDASHSYTHTAKDLTIDHISRCEYWILNRTGGSSNVNVSLTWGSPSCEVNNLSDLTIARWDAGQAKWKDEGNGKTTGSANTGTIISVSPVSVFSPFTLASKTSTNPLPVELLSFGCQVIDQRKVRLAWTTASELNNDYFLIERSADGIHFETIEKRKGAGNTSSMTHYAFDDLTRLKELSYYRLKQVDYDGKATYSQLCSATNSADGGILLYPNPVKSNLTVECDDAEKLKANTISVTDVSGKLIDLPLLYDHNKATINCSSLENGMYFIKIVTDNKEVVNKFNVIK